MEEAMEMMEENETVGTAEWDSFPLCGRKDCHAWQDGRCAALSDNDFGSRSCPFYKNRDINREEQKKTMAHLIETGRVKLIKKYRKVLEPLGLFEVADGFTDGVAEELEKYSDDVLQELLSGGSDISDCSGTGDAGNAGDAGEDDWDD